MKYESKNNKRLKQIKNRVTALSFTAVFLLSTFSPRATRAATEESGKGNATLFVQIMDNAVSMFKSVGRNDDFSVSGMFTFNPLSIVRNEVSCLDDNNLKEEFTKDEVIEKSKVVEQIVINPFSIGEGEITKQESSVQTVGNPADNSKKKILIYHSHTSEAYSVDESRTTDVNRNIVTVGDALTKELEKQGFTVIHDKTIHDLDYNKSYYKSRETVSRYYSKYGNFDFVIDMHRDAGPDKKHVTANIDGQNIARLMFVTTTKNPRYKAQIENIKSIFEISNKLCPNLFRERNLYENPTGVKYYNQDLNDNAVLVEVGATTNNLQEAINSMKYFGQVVSEHLNKAPKK